jgi:hypothetical protein
MKNEKLLLTSAHSKLNTAILVLAIAMMLFSSGKINAQNTNLYVTTETHINGKAFKGYMVTVYEDLQGNGDFSPIDQYMATSGKNRFDMKYNSAYMIDFATPADLHYTVQFDTHMSIAQTAEDRDFEIDVDFSKLDVNEYPNTIEMVSFNDEEQNFTFRPLVDAKVQQAAVK